MSDKQAIIDLGNAADRLLKDEAAGRAIEAVVDDLMGEWKRSRPDDIATREGCYRMVHAVQLVVAKLQTFRANGLKETTDAEMRQRQEQTGVSTFH